MREHARTSLIKHPWLFKAVTGLGATGSSSEVPKPIEEQLQQVSLLPLPLGPLASMAHAGYSSNSGERELHVHGAACVGNASINSMMAKHSSMRACSTVPHQSAYDSFIARWGAAHKTPALQLWRSLPASARTLVLLVVLEAAAWVLGVTLTAALVGSLLLLHGDGPYLTMAAAARCCTGLSSMQVGVLHRHVTDV